MNITLLLVIGIHIISFLFYLVTVGHFISFFGKYRLKHETPFSRSKVMRWQTTVSFYTFFVVAYLIASFSLIFALSR